MVQEKPILAFFVLIYNHFELKDSQNILFSVSSRRTGCPVSEGGRNRGVGAHRHHVYQTLRRSSEEAENIEHDWIYGDKRAAHSSGLLWKCKSSSIAESEADSP